MHYFIDGYNLLFRLKPKQSPLETSRTDIISSVNELALELKLNITLVFDATKQKERIGSTRSHFDSIEIVYTRENQTADEYILEELEYSRHPSQEMIVTSDKELAGRAKNLGAQTKSIESFVEWLLKKKTKRKKAPQKIFRDSDKQIERLLKIFTDLLDETDKN